MISKKMNYLISKNYFFILFDAYTQINLFSFNSFIFPNSPNKTQRRGMGGGNYFSILSNICIFSRSIMLLLALSFHSVFEVRHFLSTAAQQKMTNIYFKHPTSIAFVQIIYSNEIFFNF